MLLPAKRSSSWFRPVAWAGAACVLLAAPLAYADVPTTERAALVALYTGTGGPGWSHSAHWNGADPVCPGTPANNWYGITCDATNTTVIGVGLSDNGLAGALPALSGLTNLQTFDVESNTLSGSLPPLAGLTSLRYFNANLNAISGPIPPLTGLTQLGQFLVEHNALTGGIPSLQGLSALQAFEVDRNLLTGALPSLSGLTTLTYLSVFDNQLSGPFPDLTGLTHLNALLLSNNRLSGAIPAGALAIPSNLIYFKIGGNAFTGPLPAAPTTLTAGQSTLCPNLLDHVASPAWDTATGVNPWYSTCTTLGSTTAIQFVSPATPGAGDTVTVNFAIDRVVDSGPLEPSGSVVVTDSVDGSATCSATLPVSDVTTCTLTFASSGPHTLTAAYSGDVNFAPSSGTFLVTVSGAPSTTALTLSPSSATVGQTVAANVKITFPLLGITNAPGVPTGSVVITDGTVSCTATLAPGSGPTGVGSCALSFATTGTHTLTATYSGDKLYNPSSATADEIVTAAIPALMLSFAPPVVAEGATALLTIALTNPNSSDVHVTSLKVTASAGPGALYVASNDCSGTVGLTPTQVILTNAVIGLSSACNIVVGVASKAPATYTFAAGIGDLQTSVGNNASAVSAGLTVVLPIAPTVALSFTPASIVPNGISTLTFTLANANTTPLLLVGFSDSLPAGLVIANPVNATTNCPNASAVASPGGTAFGVSNSAVGLVTSVIPALGSCTASVAVTSSTPGSYTNAVPAGALTTQTTSPPDSSIVGLTENNITAASATLVVTAIAPPVTGAGTVPAPLLDPWALLALTTLLGLFAAYRLPR